MPVLLFDAGKSMKKKTLLNLPKLKQDIIKSIFRTDNKRYGGIVEKIIQRKQKEKKKRFSYLYFFHCLHTYEPLLVLRLYAF